MIDEKKLIEEIGEYTISVYGCDINDIIAFQTNNESKSAYIVQGICEAIDFIEEQPKVGEWIPCSERLPEKTGYYLAQLSRKLPNEDYADRVVVLYNGEDKEFMAYERLIIAWQPLPEPYHKGE